MDTILDALKGISGYPIPVRTIVTVAERRGLSPDYSVSQDVMESNEYRLTTADLMLWLSYAPNVSQGGQTYSFNEDQRVQLRNAANAIYAELGEQVTSGITYGYKGSRL